MTGLHGQGMALMRVASSGSPMMGRAPTGVADHDEALGAAGLARAAMHQRDG
jgi:hypothetical protein